MKNFVVRVGLEPVSHWGKSQHSALTDLATNSHGFGQSPHSDYVTRCYFNLCLQQGSRDDRVSREANTHNQRGVDHSCLVFCMYLV